MLYKYIESVMDGGMDLIILKDENDEYHVYKCYDDIIGEFDYESSYKNLVFDCSEVIIGFDKIVRM